ncbi:hypothetical protein RJ035_002536 [Blastomyces gilchristii]
MKFLSLTLMTLAGLLTSTLALPNQSFESVISCVDIDADKSIPSILSPTELGLSARGGPALDCYDHRYKGHKFAANGRYAIREAGKKRDNIKGKNIYEVTKKYCHQNNGHRFTRRSSKKENTYWFQNAWKNFPLPFVPMGIEIINYGKAGRINAKVCTDMMARLISGCIAQKASRLNHFRGGLLSDGSGWTYHIYCDADYCWS